MSRDLVDALPKLAMKARRWRLSGDHHNGHDHDYPLIGFCFDNAYVCWHVLRDNGIEVRIVEGTTERVADDLIQHGIAIDSLNSTSELDGQVHYWVEAEDGETTWLIDIASEGIDHFDECLVTDAPPDDYHVLPDSYEQGAKSLEHNIDRGHRCRCCGDHKYSGGGCPACFDLSEADLD